MEASNRMGGTAMPTPRSNRPIPFCIVLAAIVLALPRASAVGEGAARPPDVLSWRHQSLNDDRYRELAQAWGAFVQAHPADARAWVQYGQALRYGGEGEKGRQAYAKAFAADSTDAVALAAYAGSEIMYANKPGTFALQDARLRRAMERDPTYPATYYTLWLTSLRGGDQAMADDCLRRMVSTGDMPRPLLEYGYNMLAGAPQNAIIFTNGDNDTYPPLALQVMRGLRPDVSIVNLSLLNTTWYIRYQRDRGLPIPLTDAVIDTLRPKPNNWISAQVAQILYDELAAKGWPRPLCYSVTVPEPARRLPVGLSIEGILLRVVPGAAAGPPQLDLARTRELFDTVYRIESTTDPLIDWERESSVARSSLNYSSLLMQLGEAAPSPDAGCDNGVYLYRAVEIMAAHRAQAGEWLDQLMKHWTETSPTSPWLARARKLVG